MGGHGDDVLDGGAGGDTLYGGTDISSNNPNGNDTYLFGRGSGQDIIIDPDPTANNIDTIWLGSNLTPNDIAIKRIGNDLILQINNTTDKLTVKDFFKNNSPLNRIERIQFMDSENFYAGLDNKAALAYG